MDRDAYLLHQVHPAKLAADLTASVVSNTLLWRHRPVPGLLVRYLLPVAGSALVLTLGEPAALRERPAGRYVLAHMPPVTQAIRLAGDTLMALGSWLRRPWLIAAGVLVVLVGWSHGLWPAWLPGAGRPGD